MGVKFTGDIWVQPNGGPVPISAGGTGQITANAALNALLPSQPGNADKVLTTNGLTPSWTTITPGTGSVTTVSVASANGLAGTVATASTTPVITLSTSVSGMVKGNGTALLAATSGTDYSAGTASLGTGILKSTTGSGALSIAVAGDFPILNQNTTGNAQSATNATTAYGLSGISTNGIVIRTSGNSFTTQSLAYSNVGGPVALTITNADGVSGAPTITFTSSTSATADTVVARNGSGAIAVGDSSTVGGVTVGYRSIPRLTSTTLTSSSVGKCHAISAGATVPASTFSAGDAVTIYNESSSPIVLTQGSGLTLRLAGSATTGNRTLAGYGMATVWFNSASEAIASGAGLT